MTQIPMLDLKREYTYMKAEIDTAVKKCLEHQQWILGPEIEELEGKIADYLSVKHCVGISSGTDALVISLRALALKLKNKEYFDKEDKIITTPFTFTATGDAILRSGATPVFIDIDPVTFNINAKRIEEYLSSATNVIGIIPVHLYGQSCQMEKIMQIAQKNNLFVVEDAAQAFGGSWKDKKLGTIGDIGAFSFFPSKNLGGFGDGGMIATNDDALADLANILKKHGGKNKYNVDHIGYNARLDTLQAAVLLAKLKYIDEFNQKRKQIAKKYTEKLNTINDLVLPEISDGHVFHQYTIRVLNGKRDTLQKQLKESGIDSVVYYSVLLTDMKVFEMCCEIDGTLEGALRATQEVLSLPMEPLFTDEEITNICKAVRLD